jgi:hypothetical protein
MAQDASPEPSTGCNTLKSPTVADVRDDLRSSLPSPLYRLNVAGSRVSPHLLARMATVLEESGAILVTNAYVDPNGGGAGAFELGKAFHQFLEARTHIKAQIIFLKGPDWMKDREHLSLRDLFDAFTADMLAASSDSAA